MLVFSVDYDGTVVVDDLPYADLVTPPTLVRGVKEALWSLRRAGHVLLLSSARANLALREDPELDPLVRCGARPLDRRAWQESRGLHVARYEQMVAHVERELPGVFHAVDDGRQGKPAADLYVDDRAFKMVPGGWAELARAHGAAPAPGTKFETGEEARARWASRAG